MNELIKYLTNNHIKFTRTDDIRVSIDGKSYLLVSPDHEGVIFDKEFELMPDEVCERYVYEFGGNWYWEEDPLTPKMNELRYLGKVDCEIETEAFLGVHGGYEILNGSKLYDAWCNKARFLGVKHLGICEKNTLAGILKFQLECQKKGIHSILGATYTVLREKDDVRYDIKLFVKDEEGWNNLLMINKEVNVINKKFIQEERLFQLTEGLFVVLDPKSSDFDAVSHKISKRADYFQLDTVHYTSEDRDDWYVNNVQKFLKSGMKYISMTDAYYLEPDHAHIKKTLNAMSGISEPNSENQYFKNKGEYYDELDSLFDPEEELFFDIYNAAVGNELELAKACSFTVQLGERHLPKYAMTEEERAKFATNEDLFWYLIEDGMKRKCHGDPEIYLQRIEKEYIVIEKGDVIDYFLILWDIIKYARSQDILVGIGRGSAGGSIISYFLDIIQLDPIEFDLLFERFLNEGRIVKSLPDIDTDFPGTKREVIKKYMETRYGETQVCSVGTYTALQVKASIKDLGKQYGVDFGDINYITTRMPPNLKNFIDLFNECSRDSQIKGFVKSNVDLINGIQLILHQPKAKSIHACAMLILPKEKEMFQWLPISCIDGQMVSEWEGPELEKAGFLKEDILGIKQLDKFEDIITLIKENKQEVIDIYNIDLTDRRVYREFSKGHNEDVFHFGSRGLTEYCKQLKPENIEDLIAAISLYRPGAMENNFHNEYVARKEGKKEVEYYTGTEDILNKTYGIFCYQEQIMKLCQVLGGLTLVEADDVRKAMVKKTYEELTKYKTRFIPYYVENFGVTQEYSEKVWEAIDRASTYLFNRSHAAAYAITGYIGQWFKVNYPLEYWSVAFKHSEDTDHANYISEIHKKGDIRVESVDINKSRDGVSTDFQNSIIYWPITSVKQCGEKAAEQLILERDTNGMYFSFEEFLSRHKFTGSKVNKQVIENLITVGAFDKLEKLKKQSERINLVRMYREINKVKVTSPNDLFDNSPELVTQDWWWGLQQKRLSGITLFNYHDILNEFMSSDNAIIDIDQFQTPAAVKTYVRMFGYINEVKEFTKKNGDSWYRVNVECNYNLFNILIWPEQHDTIEGDLRNDVGKLILFDGRVDADPYKKENVLQSYKEFKCMILG